MAKKKSTTKKAVDKPKDKPKDKSKDKPKEEVGTICQWCGSKASVVIKGILNACKKVGKIGGYFKGLFKSEKKPAEGLPKIEIKEVESEKSEPPAPEEPEESKETSKEKKEATEAKDLKEIAFVYKNPKAKKVKLAGDFTNWEAIAMNKGSNNEWKAKVKMSPGKHTYKFVVDGEWIKDPKNTKFQPDGYGGKNSVIEVK